MHVELEGTGKNGAEKRYRWTLIAENGDGPYVPALAGAALASKLARNEIHQVGAHPCIGILSLKDFEKAMSGLSIAMEMREL